MIMIDFTSLFKLSDLWILKGQIGSGKSAVSYHCTYTERLLSPYGWKIGNGMQIVLPKA